MKSGAVPLDRNRTQLGLWQCLRIRDVLCILSMGQRGAPRRGTWRGPRSRPSPP